MKMRNEEMNLSEHFTLGELTKTKVKLVNVSRAIAGVPILRGR